MRSLYILILVAILCVSVTSSETETQEADEVVEHKDRPELQQCRDANKGKWCTCRKLLKFVEKQIGKVLGIYIPSCGRFKPKLFLPKQCCGASCWCASPKSGRMVPGTVREDAEMAGLECNPPYGEK